MGKYPARLRSLPRASWVCCATPSGLLSHRPLPQMVTPGRSERTVCRRNTDSFLSSAWFAPAFGVYLVAFIFALYWAALRDGWFSGSVRTVIADVFTAGVLGITAVTLAAPPLFALLPT